MGLVGHLSAAFWSLSDAFFGLSDIASIGVILSVSSHIDAATAAPDRDQGPCRGLGLKHTGARRARRSPKTRRVMHALGLRTTISSLFTATAISVLACAGLGAAPSAAAVPDACGLITESTIAKAFGLSHAEKRGTLVLAPGNGAGVVQDRCQALVWSGGKPFNPRQRKEKFVNGTVASLRVETWATDPGPSAGTWQMNFNSKLKGQLTASRVRLVKGLHGTSFVPPKLGALRAVAYQGATNKTRAVQGFWWNPSDHSLISVSVVAARGKPAGASLRRIAAILVPKFD